MRLSLACALFAVALAGCGDSGDDSGGPAVPDANPRPVPTDCSPAPQGGCPTGEKCGGVQESSKVLVSRFDCVAQGDKLRTQACTRDANGVDDCAGGLECYQGQCEILCQVGVATSCRGESVVCAVVEGFPDDDTGLCLVP